MAQRGHQPHASGVQARACGKGHAAFGNVFPGLAHVLPGRDPFGRIDGGACAIVDQLFTHDHRIGTPGIGAPVVMRTHWPAGTSSANACPAKALPTIGKWVV